MPYSVTAVWHFTFGLKINPSGVKAARVFDCEQSLTFNMIFQKEVSNT